LKKSKLSCYLELHLGKLEVDLVNVFSIQSNSDNFNLLVAAGAPKTLRQMTQTQLGIELGSQWEGLAVCDLTSEDESYRGPLPAGDFSGIALCGIGATMPTFKKLGQEFEATGEFLPVQYQDSTDQIYWYHCTTVIDALDDEHIICDRRADGRPLAIERFWFHADRLQSALVFQDPNCGRKLFCTDVFKNQVERLGLTGLTFFRRWSDEPEGIARMVKWEQEAYKGRMPPWGAQPVGKLFG
jgi:hypothetical protein